MRPNGTEIKWEIFRKLIYAMLTIQPRIAKILNAKAIGTEILGNKFWKIGYTSRGCHFFRKFQKMLFHQLLEISENSKQNFCWNGKHL